MTESLKRLAHARERISKRASDPRLLLVPGLADDLRLIGEAFGILETLASCLASIALRKHFGQTDITSAEYETLSALAGEWRSNHLALERSLS